MMVTATVLTKSRVRIDGEWVEANIKFNPYHDPETGRFSEGDGVSGDREGAWREKIKAIEAKLVDLSHERAVVISTKGKVFYDKTGSINDVAFTPNEASKWKGTILTHNHPGSHYPFSTTDIRFAAAMELEEIRVVSQKGRIVYSMRPGSEGWNERRWNDVIAPAYKQATDAVWKEVDKEANIVPRHIVIDRIWEKTAKIAGMIYSKHALEEVALVALRDTILQVKRQDLSFVDGLKLASSIINVLSPDDQNTARGYLEELGNLQSLLTGMTDDDADVSAKFNLHHDPDTGQFSESDGGIYSGIATADAVYDKKVKDALNAWATQKGNPMVWGALAYNGVRYNDPELRSFNENNLGNLMYAGGVKVYLEKKGHSLEAIERVVSLLNQRKRNGNDVNDKIVNELTNDTPAGKALRDYFELETAAFRAIKNNKHWVRESSIYRKTKKGEVPGPVQSWTWRSKGAIPNMITSPDMRMTPNISMKVKDVLRDYRIFGGLVYFTGYQGESELTLIRRDVLEKKSKSLDVAEKKTPSETPPSPRSKIARGAAAQIAIGEDTRNKLALLTKQYIDKTLKIPRGGNLDYYYSKVFQEQLRRNMLTSYLAGLRANGVDIDIPAKMTSVQFREFLEMYDSQVKYFSRFHVDMIDKVRRGGTLGPKEIARSRLYGTATNNAFNSAKITALGDKADDYLIEWHLRPAEHCSSCLTLAQGSPYRASELKQRPGDGSQLCDGNCKCFLVFRKVPKAKFLDFVISDTDIPKYNVKSVSDIKLLDDHKWVHERVANLNGNGDFNTFSTIHDKIASEIVTRGYAHLTDIGQKFNPHHDDLGRFAEGGTTAIGRRNDVVLTKMSVEQMLTESKRNDEILDSGFRVESEDDKSTKLTVKETKAKVVKEIADRLKGNTEFEAYVKRERGNEVLDIYTGEIKNDIDAGRIKAVDWLVQIWAGTSGDNDLVAVALQTRAQKLFKLNNATMDHMKLTAKRKQLLDSDLLTNAKAYDAYLTAVYDNTQSYLKANNIKAFMVYRGMSTASPVAISDTGGRVETVKLQPLSSFSTNPWWSMGFANTAVQDRPHLAIIYAKVPAKRIFSTSWTGAGCKNESEVIITGSTEKWNIIRKKYIPGDPYSIFSGSNEGLSDIARSSGSEQKDMTSVKTKIANVVEPDRDLRNADWTKRTWDLPLYLSLEFMEYLKRSGRTLEEFQKSPAFTFAVQKAVAEKFNPRHDPETGRFDYSDAGGATISGAAVSALDDMPLEGGHTGEAKAWVRKNQKLYDTDRDFKTVVDALTLYTQGSYDDIDSASYGAEYGNWNDLRRYDKKMSPNAPLHTLASASYKYENYFIGQDIENKSKATVFDAGEAINLAIRDSKTLDIPIYRGVGGYFQYESYDTHFTKKLVPVSKDPLQQLPKLKPGDSFDIKGTASFTTNENIADSFASGRGGRISKRAIRDTFPVQIVLKVLPGARGLKAAALSPWKQKEVLTRGKFTVVDVDGDYGYDKESGRWTITLKQDET